MTEHDWSEQDIRGPDRDMAVDQNRPRHAPQAALHVDPKLVAVGEQLNSPGLTWTLQDREKDIETPVGRERDITGTPPRHHRDKNRTCLPTCAAPRRIIHVRPQAYRSCGIMNLHQCSSICQCSTSVVLKLRNCIYLSFTKCGIWHRQHVFPII